MNVILEAGRTDSRKSPSEVSWWKYAEAYDLLCSINPYYQENLDSFRQWFSQLEIRPGSNICEIGAGTGNFLFEAAKLRPDLVFTHWDWNSSMNEIASRKYKTLSATTINVTSSDLAAYPLDQGPFDAVIAVNTLYTLSAPNEFLEKIIESLKVGGVLFCIDLGRPLDTFEWAKDLAKRSLRKDGIVHTLKLVFKLREAIWQNKAIDRSQLTGRYWEHTPEAFRGVMEDVGFEVITQAVCYREKCDLVVAKRIADVELDSVNGQWSSAQVDELRDATHELASYARTFK